MDFTTLPENDLILIAENMDYREIQNLCKANSRFNSVICRSETFWRKKVYQDFGNPGFYVPSWRNFYKLKVSGKIYALTNGQIAENFFKFSDSIPVSLQVGISYFCILYQNGSVVFYLYEVFGELPRTISIIDEIDPKIPIKIVQVSCGFRCILFLDENGDVWAFGNNQFGKCGFPANREQINPPEKIPNLSQIIQVEAGTLMNLFLKENGEVWVCGKSKSGELGVHNQPIRAPIRIQNLPPIHYMSIGPGRALFLDRNNQVWQLGGREEHIGQLLRKINTTMIPKIISIMTSGKFEQADSNYLLGETGQVWRTDYDSEDLIPFPVAGLDKIVRFTPGYTDSFFFKVDGSVVKRSNLTPYPTTQLVAIPVRISEIIGIYSFTLAIGILIT